MQNQTNLIPYQWHRLEFSMGGGGRDLGAELLAAKGWGLGEEH